MDRIGRLGGGIIITQRHRGAESWGLGWGDLDRINRIDRIGGLGGRIITQRRRGAESWGLGWGDFYRIDRIDRIWGLGGGLDRERD